MRFFGLKSCETCRKALARLRAAGYDLQVIDVRADGIAPDDLAMIVAQFGDAAINRASTTWRELSDLQRQDNPVALLAAYPTLLKRPVIDNAGVWHQGWRPEVRKLLV